MTKHLITSLIFIVALSGLIISLINLKSRTKLAYIDTGIVYKNFKLSKELNNEMESVVNVRKFIIDSMLQELNYKAKILNSTKPSESELISFETLKENYDYKLNQFEIDNKKIREANNRKIWIQLNKFISDYGKEGNYTFILGANGQGTIMYGNKAEDITQLIIEYINTRYDGKDN